VRVTGSFFADVYDNNPRVFDTTWAAFVAALREAAGLRTDPAEKHNAICLSPAQYAPLSKRGVAGARAWDWAAVDLDDKTGKGWRFEEATEYLDGLGLAYLVYSTSSHTAERHCLRAAMPLSRPVVKAEFARFWRALNQMFASQVDAGTKDISRLFIEPRAWTGAPNMIAARVHGSPLDPDQLMATFPCLPPSSPPTDRASAPVVALRRARTPRAGTDFFVLTDLEHSPIVPRQALEKAFSARSGGRMISFLTACAMSALARGYDIDEHTLEVLGGNLAMLLGRRRDDIRHDAASALRFAQQRVAESEAAKLIKRQRALFGG
jgi:hypothetical protein